MQDKYSLKGCNMLKPVKVQIVSFIPIGVTFNLNSQTFQLLRYSSSVKIAGTSNFHDWKMKLREFNCSASIALNGLEPEGIDKVVFICRSTDL